MKVDIVHTTNGNCEVRPRDAAPGTYDEKWEGVPLFGPAPDDECVEWCEARRHEYRHRKFVAPVPIRFLRDAEACCDRWRENLDAAAATCGYRLESDITYRASAAWKEHPAHYCYSGYMGESARLVRAVSGCPENPAALVDAKTTLSVLYGAAAALWELGLTLTFDKDGKHTIYGLFGQWVTLDEEE